MAALGGGNRAFGQAKAVAAAGLDLDENEAIAVLGDDVDLAGPAAVVGLAHGQAFALEQALGQAFARLAEPATGEAHAASSGAPGVAQRRTGAKERRWIGEGQSAARRSRWASVP